MNTKMKVLSLALVGTFGYVGAASAVCPTDPAQAGGGAWTNKFVNGGTSALAINTPGYDGSECKLESALGNNGGAQAQVMDDSPSDEPSYRAQFIIDAGALSGANGGSQAMVFAANPAAAHSGILQLVKVVFGGSGGGGATSGKKITFRVACEGGPGAVCGSAPVTLPNQTGPNRVEIALTVGSTGTFRYWVNDAATTGITEASGTSVTLTGGNAGWIGVDKALLGLASPTTAYRSVNTDAKAYFDQFDSRRTTFIGHN